LVNSFILVFSLNAISKFSYSISLVDQKSEADRGIVNNIFVSHTLLVVFVSSTKICHIPLLCALIRWNLPNFCCCRYRHYDKN